MRVPPPQKGRWSWSVVSGILRAPQNDHDTIMTSNGHHNTAHVKAGAVLTVPADASGPADNEIIAQ